METRVCTRCLLRDMIEAGDSMEMIEKYRAAIKAADRVTEEVYESRLAVCRDCEKLNAGTCMACGCYVELRAVTSDMLPRQITGRKTWYLKRWQLIIRPLIGIIR